MMTTEQSITVSQHDVIDEYKKILALKIEGRISGEFFHHYISQAHVREAFGFADPQEVPPIMKQISASNLCCEISLPSSGESWTQIGRDNIPVGELPIGAIL